MINDGREGTASPRCGREATTDVDLDSTEKSRSKTTFQSDRYLSVVPPVDSAKKSL